MTGNVNHFSVGALATGVLTRIADLPSNGNDGKRHIADQCPVTNTRARRMVELKPTDRGGSMQPIDFRELEALRRFRLLRAAYFGSPVETSSTDRSHRANDDRTDRRVTHCDPRA